MNALEKILVDLALSKSIIEQTQVDKALDIQKSSPMKNFGRILADLGFINDDQLEKLKSEAELIFKNKGRVPSSASGSISLKQDADFSKFIEDESTRRYSKKDNGNLPKDGDKLIGTEFVGCKIIKKLGEGGMGRIYKVRHQFLNKYMAMKILSQQHTEQKLFVQRFFREARSAAKLNHPNIVKIFDVGVVNNEHYILMQLVDGVDLKKIVAKQGRMSVRDAIFIVTEVAKALVEAHQQKIIHRDIKPDNIMLNQTQVMVTDFGLAKIEGGEGEGSEVMTLTSPGQVLGSPYFMAPEQADSSHEVDNRTDIYSLGSTFYYLVTGKYPFDGPNAIAIIFKRINQPLIRPKKIDPQIPECVNKLIVKMMAVRRESRPETARMLLKELIELPLKNKVRNFADLDFHKNVNIDESNRLLAQSEMVSQRKPRVTSNINNVGSSTTKTRLRTIQELKEKLQEAERSEQLDLDIISDYGANRTESAGKATSSKHKKIDFTSMTDFFDKQPKQDAKTKANGSNTRLAKVSAKSSNIAQANPNPKPSESQIRAQEFSSTPSFSKSSTRKTNVVKKRASQIVPAQQGLDGLLAKAQMLFDARKYAQSLAMYKEIQKRFPNDKFVQNKTANIENRFKSANNHYRNAQTLFAKGEIEDAVRQLKESLTFLPGNPDILKFLDVIIKSNTEINKILSGAYELYKTGKIKEAIQKASESFKYVKNHPKTQNLIEKLQKVLDKRSV